MIAASGLHPMLWACGPDQRFAALREIAVRFAQQCVRNVIKTTRQIASSPLQLGTTWFILVR
jgi:hypothetical protein